MKTFHATLWIRTDIEEPDLGLTFLAKDEDDAKRIVEWMNGSCIPNQWWMFDGKEEVEIVN